MTPLLLAAALWLGADPRFGVVLGLANRYAPHERDRAARLARDAGFGWVREEFTWDEIEPRAGQWQWERYDRAVDLAARHGLRILGLLAYGARWASPEHGRSERPDFYAPALAPFAEYVRRTVTRYRGRISHWEVWNEPNIAEFWRPAPDPEGYARLLVTAAQAIREADPAARVVAMSTSGSDLAFIEAALDAAGCESFDVVAVHPYRSVPEEPDLAADLTAIRQRLRSRGCERPLWVTELGWPTRPSEASDAEQARLLVRGLVLALAGGAERVFWYDLRDDAGPESQQGFGLLRRDFRPKPAWVAARDMTRKLGGLAFEAVLDRPPPARACRFGDGRRAVVVAWDDSGRPVFVPVR